MRQIKRIAAVCMAVCMILGLSVTAFAAENDPITQGNLTVTGAQLAGKTVTAVRMFEATVKEGSTQNEYIFNSYVLEKAWEGFFTTKITTAEGNVSEKAVEYIQKLSDDNAVANFASEALAWYGENTEVLKGLASTATATDEGKAIFTGLDAGYYLVFAGSGPAMLVNIPRDKECTIKSEFPTVDKKVDTDSNGAFADNGSAQIGDTVTFSLTSAVPDMTGYKTYQFNFVDTMSNGLTFVPNSVTVKIGTHNLSLNNNYTIKEPDENESNTLRVEIKDLLKVVKSLNNVNSQAPVKTGTPIVVTYQAVINEKALMEKPATNEAKVEYSNNPSGGGTGESAPDTSKVYTYAINVHKWSVGNGETNYLAGAKFVLSKSETIIGKDPEYTGDSNIIPLVKEVNAPTYRVAKPTDKDTQKTFTTVDGSPIHIEGLEVGTYYLHEIEAPGGYNELKAPIKIEISVEKDDYNNPIYKINDTQNAQKNITVKVENKKGIEFPETGGIGTIGLTVLGVGVILLGVLVPRKKKKDQTTQE